MKKLKHRELRIKTAALLFITIFAYSASGQDTQTADRSVPLNSDREISLKRRSLKMNTLTFGGTGVNFTRVNNQFSVMTGGSGSATFNKRYTIGGGGWGMTKGVKAESNAEGVYNFIKMGYGGIDFGYLILPSDRLNLGTRLLIAGGAVFNETVPESDDRSFKLFPVLEPSLFFQVALSKLFRFETGASYRYIRGTNLPYVSDRELSGFSCHIGFLVRAGKGD